MDDHTVDAAAWQSHRDKADLYSSLGHQIAGLQSDETDLIANLANASATIYHGLPLLNWAGFYLFRGTELVLGPFQGRPACVRIPLGKGVCGAAAVRRESVLVQDVYAFPGHIACDETSRSELVIPMLHGDALFGVMDLDSPQPARFDAHDQAGCEALVAIIMRHFDLTAPT